MQKFKRVTLSLDEETKQILDWFNDYTEFSKSELIRYMLLYFKENKSELYNIIHAQV
ncbi:hypothetical protein LCGC14_3113340 [marine sediment metagenome]|uniref:Ribbon-helix-helix protein CopG domain-containing protein n=1 Tax=marine sediment metagenome TaxID=412755 RepID=A0A0F8YBU0_9ZZZZ